MRRLTPGGGHGLHTEGHVAAPVVETPEVAATAPAIESLAEQLDELRERVDTVRETRDRLRGEVRESPELAPFRETMDSADAAYESGKKTDQAYIAATKAEEDAQNAFRKLVQQKFEADEDAQRIRQAKPESKEAEKEIRERLEEIRRRIEEDDADVRAAREALEAARKARREAYESEALSELRKARDAARTAYEAEVKELEEANAELAAAIREREDLRTQVAELEQKLAAQPGHHRDTGARKRGFTAGPYLAGLGPEGDSLTVTAYGDTGEAFDHVVLKKRNGCREFGETVPATALEFLQSAKRFATFSFPHVQSGVRSREFSFTVRNPYADDMHGELSWEIPNKAWSVNPPRQPPHQECSPTRSPLPRRNTWCARRGKAPLNMLSVAEVMGRATLLVQIRTARSSPPAASGFRRSCAPARGASPSGPPNSRDHDGGHAWRLTQRAGLLYHAER